jgi:hypothetical protein
MYTSQPEAVPAQVALAQSETLRSEDLDTSATSHGKLIITRTKMSFSPIYLTGFSPKNPPPPPLPPQRNIFFGVCMALATSIVMTFEKKKLNP